MPTFFRYQKLEEGRIQKEHEFRIKQMQIENERRKEEREHEMNVLHMILSSQQPARGDLPGNNSFNTPVFYTLVYPNVVPDNSATQTTLIKRHDFSKNLDFALSPCWF